MPEPSFKTYNPMAERLFRRGAAAASVGQRTVAAGLLRQAVRLNPGHEQAWLWLSGVVDDPQDVRFCLETALQLNPGNERARQGLAKLQEDALQPEDAASLRRRRATFAPASTTTRLPWWQLWRDARVVWRGAMVMIWLIPCLLLITTGIVRLILVNRPLPVFTTARAAAQTPPRPAPSPLPQPTSPPPPTATPAVVSTKAVASYLAHTHDIQTTLQQATTTYRAASAASATSVERVTAINALKSIVAQQQNRLAALTPPTSLKTSHTRYLQGLDLERRALEDMLTFYGSNDFTAANRAARYLQDARLAIADGKAGWETAQGIATATPEQSPNHEKAQATAVPETP